MGWSSKYNRYFSPTLYEPLLCYYRERFWEPTFQPVNPFKTTVDGRNPAQWWDKLPTSTGEPDFWTINSTRWGISDTLGKGGRGPAIYLTFWRLPNCTSKSKAYLSHRKQRNRTWPTGGKIPGKSMNGMPSNHFAMAAAIWTLTKSSWATQETHLPYLVFHQPLVLAKAWGPLFSN